MDYNSVEKTKETILGLIDKKFGFDTHFEREAGLPPKTVNNWRRGLSSSFMKMLPELAELFGVSVSRLLGEAATDLGALSDDEQEIIGLYRSAGDLSERELRALAATIKNTIDLYMSSRKSDD